MKWVDIWPVDERMAVIDQRPFPRRAESGAASVALRAPGAPPDYVFLPLDIVILQFDILSNHCPKKSWGGGITPTSPYTKERTQLGPDLALPTLESSGIFYRKICGPALRGR